MPVDFSKYTPEQLEEARLKVAAVAWRRGNLAYQLRPTQQKIAKQLLESKSRKFFLLCARRLGKSFMLVNLAIQTALQKPRARVLYLAPFAKNAEEISGDVAETVLLDCPADLRPEYSTQSKEFRFKNGSVIRIKGTNGEHARFLRGGAADLVVLDECGIMDDLSHVVSDVCVPMTLTTNGRILLATTPGRSPSHESTKLFEDLASKEAVSVYTIRDNDMVDAYTKVEYLMEAGETPEHARRIIFDGADPTTTTAQREYFCQFVTDASSAVVKEFTPELQKRIVRPWSPVPSHYDSYVSIDPGFKDRTGILFASYDFVQGKLHIQGERLLNQANTQDIAQALQTTENELWLGKPPVLRVSDVDLRLVADLWSMHGIAVRPTKKEDSLGAINLMRNMVQSEQINIDPSCVHLIRQLKNATWNNKATDFEQGGDIDGHFDLVAALKYLCRNVSRTRNPFPEHFYRRGGVMGQPEGTWASPRSQKRLGLGLLSDTPFGKKVLRRGR